MECPACHGERGFDVSGFDEPLTYLARAVGLVLDAVNWLTCDVCDGEGEVTEADARDYDAYWRARTDQLLAGVDDGSIQL